VSADLTLVCAFAARQPNSVARVLEQSDDLDTVSVLEALPSDDATAVLRAMAPLVAARALERMRRAAAVAILLALPLDVGSALLRRVPETPRKALLSALGDGPRARSLAELLQHEPGTAGALMDPLVLALPEELCAGAALDLVRREPSNAMYYLYVVAERGRLAGVVNQRELMLAEPGTALPSIMTREPEALLAQATREGIVGHPAWQIVHALPVVDKGGVLLGAIRYETVRRLERELGHAARQPDRHATAAALAELYGIGLAGFVEWASVSVRGPAPRRRGGAE
jgi:magnesium transporter